eukprot:2605460-Rhodomonas_salina.2
MSNVTVKDPCDIDVTTNTASSTSALTAVGTLYGFLFSVSLLIYCLIRNSKRFKTLYNVRDSVPELN